MWTRSVLKEKAKAAFARSRWGLILCCLIISFLSGATSGGGGNYTQNLQQNGSDAQGADAAANFANLFKYQNGDIPPEFLKTLIGIFVGVILASLVIGIIVSLFITNPLLVGCMRYMEEACFEQKKVGDLNLVAYVFKKGRYGNSVKTMFLMQLYEFLWSLLFIIPGIIKSYEYRMIPYIIAENPTIETKKAFELSKEMMNGNKWDAFVLDLSFLGWHLLAILTCGILEIFYVMPYEYMTNTFLYDTLKQNASFDYFDHTLGASAYNASSAGYDTYQKSYNDTFGANDQDANGGYQDDPLPVDDPTQTGGWMPVYTPDQVDQSNQDSQDSNVNPDENNV